MAPKEDQVIDEIFTKEKHGDNDNCEFQQQRSPPPQWMEVLSSQPPSDQSHVSCPGVASRKESSPSRTHDGNLKRVIVETGSSPRLFLQGNRKTITLKLDCACFHKDSLLCKLVLKVPNAFYDLMCQSFSEGCLERFCAHPESWLTLHTVKEAVFFKHPSSTL